MTREEVMKIAKSYAKQYDCDLVLYAGEIDNYHFVWMKNTSLPRYTGFGIAIKITPTGEIVNIESNVEIHDIANVALKLQNRD